MRKINLLILILIFTVSAFSQSDKKNISNKVVLINTSVFADKQQGIKMLAQLYESYLTENRKPVLLAERIDRLERELNNLQSQNKPVNEKYEEIQKLKVELNNAQKETTSERRKRYSLIQISIVEKIVEKLKEFAKLKGYAIVIDKFHKGFLIESEIEDITKIFIQFCNESFEKEKSQQ